MSPAHTYLAIHILNRAWSHCLEQNDFEALHVIDDIQTELIDDSIETLEPSVISLLGDINVWANWHEISVTA